MRPTYTCVTYPCAYVRLCSIEMPSLSIAHLDMASREVLVPAARDALRDVGGARQLLREPRLQSGVDHDRGAVGDVIAHDLPSGRVDVCRRLEAREGSPQEVDRAGRRACGLVGDHHEHPVAEGGC